MVAIARRKCVGDDEAPASISRTAARSSDHLEAISASRQPEKKKKNGPSHFFPNDDLRVSRGDYVGLSDFWISRLRSTATTRSRRVGASYQHARVDQSSPHPPQRREARPSYSTSQRRTRSRPTPAVAHAHHPPLVHRTSETLRRSVNFMSSHASMSLPAPTRVGAAARAARRVALVRYVFITRPVFPSTTRARSRPPRRSGRNRRSSKLRRLQVYKWQARKRFLPNFQPSFFFFPVCEQALIVPLIPSPRASSLAGRARLWLPPRGPCAPRALWYPQPRAARSSRTSPSPPIPAAGTARWGTT